MEFQIKLQKNKIHRYFQSYHSIPNNKCILSLQQLDRKIIMESNNLFSVFELVIFIKNQQVVSSNPLRIFRRLMTLVFCIISEYQLYLSKIKTLTTFWWQTGIEVSKRFKCNKSLKMLITVTDAQFSSFKEKCIKDEYLFHILRCFNSILQKFIANERKDSLVSNQYRQICQYLQKSFKNLKTAIFDQKQQSDHKINLILQYCNFLILTFHIRRKSIKLTNLFQQFCESINLIIRLMKKFYKSTTSQYRASLVSIIERGYKLFGDLIPDHKRKLLKIIIIFLYRKQDEKFNKIQFGDQISAGQKKSLIILSRSLNDWKLKYENKYRKSFKEIDIFSPIKKENEKIDQLPKVIKVKNYRDSFENINQGIGELKRKRSQSVKLKSEVDANEFEIKFKVQNEISKQFARLKYLKNRSYSAFSTTKQNRKHSINNQTEKEVELKLEDYKNKKYENKNKKTLSKKLKITLRV